LINERPNVYVLVVNFSTPTISHCRSQPHIDWASKVGTEYSGKEQPLDCNGDGSYNKTVDMVHSIAQPRIDPPGPALIMSDLEKYTSSDLWRRSSASSGQSWTQGPRAPSSRPRCL